MLLRRRRGKGAGTFIPDSVRGKPRLCLVQKKKKKKKEKKKHATSLLAKEKKKSPAR